MLCLWLLVLGASTDHIITTDTIRRVDMNDKDTLSIDATAKTAFIRFEPHFIFGEMSITINGSTFKANAGDRLFFQDCKILITYSKAESPSRISLWLIEMKKCLDANIHARNARSASIHVSERHMGTLCYFFEFRSKPRLSVGFEPFIPDILFMLTPAANGSVLETSIDTADHEYAAEEMLVVGITHMPGMINISVDITSDNVLSDWSDHDGVFLNCDDPGNCTAPSFSGFGLQTDREIQWWVWAAIVMTLILVMAVLTVLLFWKAVTMDAEYSLGTGALASVPSVPFT